MTTTLFVLIVNLFQRVSKNRKKGGKKGGKPGEQTDGEFDDLISALRTGDVFSEDMTKMKGRNRKRSVPQKNLIQNQKATNGQSSPKLGEMSRERLGKPKPGGAVSVSSSRTGAY